MTRTSEDSGSQLDSLPRTLPALDRSREGDRARRLLGRVLAVNGANRGSIPGGWFLDPRSQAAAR